MGVWVSTADVDVVRVLCDLVRSSEFAGDFRVKKKHAQGGQVSLVLLLLYGTLDCCLGMLYILCGMDLFGIELVGWELRYWAAEKSVLNLQNNSFCGGIPFGLGQMPHLRVIDVKNNQLNGSIPTNLFQNRRVQVILLAFNELSGKMWKGPWYVPELRVLDLTNNSLTGMIPPSFGNATKMMNFILSGNRVSGNIPKEIGNLSQLADLSLLDNQLTGSIPSTLFNISSLLGASLSFNSLSGPLLLDEGNNVSNLYFLSRIPTTTGLPLPNIKDLILGDNQLEEEISLFIRNASKLEILDLAQNFFAGTIPNNLGNLLGNNPLNAVLPNSIGNLSSTIEDFHIADEHINGLIPTSIGNMTGLTSLSLQGNNLTGSIPSEIGKLKQLQGLALYNNKLQGRIPEVVCHLSNLVQLYLDGNELSGLIPECFGNLSMLQKLYLGPNKFSSKFPLCLWKMSGLLYLDVSQNSIEGELPSDIGGLKAIVELYLYNNHFSVCKRFDTECEVMRNVRHINLVPVITTCSSDYISAFVLQFMPNGSLEKWLYKEDRHLNLHQRVTVMLDAAMAVEYLHHGHVTPIVHCDLKPANVLLDEDMVAHVEYGSKGIVSASGDVYSYGIMLMEVLTKRRPTNEKLCNENLDLRKWIIQSFSGSMMDIVDANLFCEEVQITCKSEICIASMIELALDCTKEMPESRITMKDVVKRLNKINNTFLET
ncbi:hypothetical protein KY284_019894 [Solanum tuberosum]|nr:hypothetical protein KY284_019894 [Solanum tuberosum]